MDGRHRDVESNQRADPADDIIPLDKPCPKCDSGELVIDAGDVRCDTCSFQAA